MRIQLALMGLGSESVRLVEFTRTNGDKVSVNPDDVQSVEERGNNTRIEMRDKTNHTVTEEYQVVVDALESG